MGKIKVLKPGFFSSVQDTGRHGYASYGVPCSGAMDSVSARKVNLLLTNNGKDAVLEITMTGPELLFESQTAIAVSGAQFDISLDGNRIQNDTVYNVNPGSLLRFGGLQQGFRAYLGVSGGFRTEKILGSRSMYAGTTKQDRLSKGDILEVSETPIKNTESLSRVHFSENTLQTDRVDVRPGPEFERLNTAQNNFLQDTSFTISPVSNRMAVMLNETLKNNLNGILTGPVVPGTIQLTPSGNLIILMRDCQVTGGYPRVLQLGESALSALAQKRPGTVFRFNFLSPDRK